MTSETHTRYGSGLRRQGRSRRCASYQSRSERQNPFRSPEDSGRVEGLAVNACCIFAEGWSTVSAVHGCCLRVAALAADVKPDYSSAATPDSLKSLDNARLKIPLSVSMKGMKIQSCHPERRRASLARRSRRTPFCVDPAGVSGTGYPSAVFFD